MVRKLKQLKDAISIEERVIKKAWRAVEHIYNPDQLAQIRQRILEEFPTKMVAQLKGLPEEERKAEIGKQYEHYSSIPAFVKLIRHVGVTEKDLKGLMEEALEDMKDESRGSRRRGLFGLFQGKSPKHKEKVTNVRAYR